MANVMKIWKKNENTTTLFYMKGLETFQERREQVNTIMMEHFNSILFYKSEPAKKQPIIYQSMKERKELGHEINQI